MKLIGLYTSSTGVTHAAKDGKTLCGIKAKQNSLPHSGRSRVNCLSCTKKIPDNVI